jgi:transcriptional antiterminator RfaH
MSWFVIHTKPNEEKKALANLTNQNFACYMPMYSKEKINKSKIKIAPSPLFPRYLFIEINDESIQKNIGLIRSTLGVHQLLKIGEKPIKIDTKIITELKEVENDRARQIKKYFEQGETVQIQSGTFKGIKAIFECEDINERAILFFELMQKPTKISINKVNIKKIN